MGVAHTIENQSVDFSQAHSMRDGLEILKAHLQPRGVRDIVYLYMLREKAHVRNDIVFITTFPQEVGDLYNQDGGGASYQFGDILPNMKAPLHFDVKDVLKGGNPLFSHNKCTAHIYEQGYKSAWVMPLEDPENLGYGFLMVFQDEQSGAPLMDIESLHTYVPVFQSAMKTQRNLARFFELTDAECQILSKSSEGKSVADLVHILNLSTRSVELKLQSARKKLHARTTAEAVYKALSYGILPCPRQP